MKLKLTLFFTLVFHLSTFAQIGFETHVLIDRSFGIDKATSVAAADIDGDGDIDVLSASANDHKIAWYKNLDGQGSFSPPNMIASDAMQAQAVHTADLDGDGDIDVLSASFADDKIAWYENLDGQGNFSAAQLITTAALGANAVATADLDGDGDLDVLSASFSEHKIAWYENTDGLGNFGLPQNITTEAFGAKSVYATDLDGDGDLDVLSASFTDDKIAWYENTDGLGNFGLPQVITTEANGANSVTAADIDGDGDQDVMSASGNDGKIAWYENTDGLGNFGIQQILTTNADGAEAVFASDLDGDGDQDILSASPDAIKLAWYENTNGMGDFSSQKTITTYADSTNAVITADIDGDGDQDVLSAFDNKIGLYENIDSQGESWLPQIVSVSAFGAYGVFSGDIDGDGDSDVVAISQNDGKLAWFENMDGAGSFGEQQLITIDVYNARYVSGGDMDGDGDIDILSASLEGDRTAWYKNLDGQGNFGPEQIITPDADSPRAVFPTDIDGDGDLDILTASYDDNKIAWYENFDGQGNFGFQNIITNQTIQAIDVYAADIDGDGDMDVLSASLIDDKIAWYENTDGLGDFGAQQIISDNVANASTVFADDIDGDGDLDVLTTSSGGNQTVWFENMDGLGTFSAPHLITGNAASASLIKTGDIDNDGDIDVISAFSSGDKIVWYENFDGQGTFGAQQIITNNVNLPRFIFTDDIDNDGDLDILSASQFDDKIAWYENLNLISNVLTGVVRMDLSSNGCDPDNTPLPNIKVITSNGVDNIATFSLNSGYYQLFPGEGAFTTSLTSQIPDYFNITPDSYTSNFVGIGNTGYQDFCIEPNQTINDVNISCYPTSQARPGFEATYRIVYRNVGTTVLDGNVVLEFEDSKMNFLTAAPSISSQTNNTIAFDYNNLNPFEIRTIDVTFKIFPPPTVNGEDVLSFTASITPMSVDLTADDNIFSFSQKVINAFDPNDITVLEGDEILIADVDKYLHYIIRFQNTGTADAINVRVENILDDNLDWSTFQTESISHLNRIEIRNGKEVSFIFNNIHLPDSTTNEPASHGFITYKIKPKADLVIGDSISNKADIFFDFNLPIETNTVVTKIVEPTAVENLNTLKFSVYPVPTSTILMIESPTIISEIKIYDSLGQLVLSNFNEMKMDVSSLPPGIYFCKVIDELGDFGTRKIMVARQ